MPASACRFRTPGCIIAAFLGLGGLGADPATAAQEAERGAYIVRLGRDTLAVDWFERTGGLLTGRLLLRSPSTVLLGYEITFDAEQNARRTRIRTLRPDGQPAAPARSWDIAFTADSMVAVRTIGDSSTTTRAALRRGAVPLLHVSQHAVGFALAVERALRERGDSVAVTTFTPGSRAGFDTYVRRDGPYRALFGYVAGARIVAWLGAGGRVDSLDHGESTMKVVSRRVPDVDVIALARAFAARDSAGGRLGAISPRDTLRARVAGAEVTIEYSRPAVRGRTIFGGLVPFGDVWRAGADAATHLTTTRDLDVDGVVLPAGRYTLFLAPEEDRATLLVNGATNIWGTQYDASRDVRRYPLRVVRLPNPVERLTYGVAEEGGRGYLRLDWDRTRFELAFREASR